MIKMAGSNPIESESAGKRASHTLMSKQGRPILRYCAWTSVIPMLRLNPDFRVWAKQRREWPAHANPLNGREVVGAALNRLLRLSFALVKNQTYYQVPKPETVCSQRKRDNLAIKQIDTLEAIVLLPNGSIIILSCL